MPGIFRQWLVCWAALLLSALALPAADAETRAFTSAEKYWQDKFYDRAEKEFAEFVAKYPASPRLAQALLLQSKAALAQKRHATALNLLATNLARAAGMADQFQMQIAQVHEQSGRFAEAADAFGLLVARHTNSSLRLAATLGEAKARFQLKQWARVSELLQNPEGVFAEAVRRRPELDAITDGRLLLAEALLEQRLFAATENAVSFIPDTALSGEAKWRREYLRAKAQFGAQNLDKALATSSNVVAAGAAVLKPSLEASGVALQGEILEALNQPGAAIAAYEQNQRPGIPPERVREAVFRSAVLHIAQGQLTNAVARLNKFREEHPNEEGSDVALLTMAELKLKQHQLALRATNGVAPGTNLLPEVIAHSRRVTDTFTNSPFLGHAYLVRAWALLEMGNTAESLSAFRRAADALPWSEEQAVARFKVADLESQLGESTNALRNYRRVLHEYSSLRRVQSELVPRARYQMLQASRAAGDLAAANEVMSVVAREYPPNAFSERTLLLYGQALDELGQPAKARAEFSNFVTRFPQSPLRPEVELAVGRSYERERNWLEAIAKYEAWVTNYPAHASLPETEFRRARAHFHARQITNALTLLTNYVAHFRSQPLAQHAQYMVGDLYFNADQFVEAEREYQRVYQNTNWPVNALTWEARLKAGRAAIERQSFADAREYLTSLIEAADAPEPVRVQASFAWGDAYRKRPGTNIVENFRGALVIYDQIPRYHQGNPLVPRALGEMGMCYFQLGGLENATNYAAAIDAFSKVTNSPTADVSARVLAHVGLGNALRMQARLAQTNGAAADANTLLDAALQNYLKVFYATYDEDLPDPIWIRDAGLNAADVAESRGNWESALRVYQRLAEMLPALRSGVLERKIDNASQKVLLQNR